MLFSSLLLFSTLLLATGFPGIPTDRQDINVPNSTYCPASYPNFKRSPFPFGDQCCRSSCIKAPCYNPDGFVVTAMDFTDTPGSYAKCLADCKNYTLQMSYKYDEALANNKDPTPFDKMCYFPLSTPGNSYACGQVLAASTTNCGGGGFYNSTIVGSTSSKTLADCKKDCAANPACSYPFMYQLGPPYNLTTCTLLKLNV